MTAVLTAPCHYIDRIPVLSESFFTTVYMPLQLLFLHPPKPVLPSAFAIIVHLASPCQQPRNSSISTSTVARVIWYKCSLSIRYSHNKTILLPLVINAYHLSTARNWIPATFLVFPPLLSFGHQWTAFTLPYNRLHRLLLKYLPRLQSTTIKLRLLHSPFPRFTPFTTTFLSLEIHHLPCNPLQLFLPA